MTDKPTAFLIKSFTGLSDYENKGITGSFKFGKNLDVRSDTDSLKANQALTEDVSGVTLDSVVLFIVNSSDGNAYLFTRNGKIYKRTSAGVYSLVYTDSEGVITGACEWMNDNGDTFIYWATATKLHRKALPGTSNWSDVDATVNGQTYPKTDLTSATWHTMKVIKGALYICNVSKIAIVGYDDSYSNEILQLIPGSVSKCLMEFGNYAYIGCGRSDNGQRGSLFTWDTAQSLNYNTYKHIGETPINAMLDGEYPIMQVGTSGKLRLADTSSYMLPIRSIPGGGQVNPDGIESDDLVYMGVFGNNDDVDNTTRTGVYTFGRNRLNSNPVLNLDYALDCDEIGSVKKVGTDLLISYKDGSTYGVKKVDTANKATGLFRSIDLKAPTSSYDPSWLKVRLVMKPLPVGTSVGVKRRINKTTDFVVCNLDGGATTYDTEDGTEAVFLIGDKGKVAEIEIDLNPHGNYTPEILTVEIFFT